MAGEINRLPSADSVDTKAQIHRVIAPALLAPEGSLQTSPYIGKPHNFYKGSSRKPIVVLTSRDTLSYTGEWHFQALTPTCTAWAVANAAHILGVDPNMDKIQELSAMAKDNPQKRTGLAMRTAVKIINSSNSPYFFKPLDQGHSTKSNNIKHAQDPAILKLLPPLIGEVANRRFMDPQPVINALDNRNPVLISVHSSLFFRGPRMSSHALCISGYHRTADSHLDLQLVDSARGIYWAPYELVERSLIQRRVYQAVRRADINGISS